MNKATLKKAVSGSQVITLEDAFLRGYDCEKNGANKWNCHYSIFQNADTLQKWNEGIDQAILDRPSEKENEPNPIHELFDDMIDVYYNGQ